MEAPTRTRDEEHQAYSYEFADDEEATIFLEDVGGMPHPNGGHRVLLNQKISPKKALAMMLGRAEP